MLSPKVFSPLPVPFPLSLIVGSAAPAGRQLANMVISKLTPSNILRILMSVTSSVIDGAYY
jgi:hypothetical protein